VVRIENGDVTPSGTDVEALLRAHNVTERDIIEAVIETVRANRVTPNPNPYANLAKIISPALRHYVGWEAVAKRVLLFAPNVVPDILQTEGYAATLNAVLHPDRTPDQNEMVERLRRERAAYLLGKFGPALHIIINEEALNLPEPAAGWSDRSEQYASLRLIIDGIKALHTTGRELSPGSQLNPRITVQIARYPDGTHLLSKRHYNLLRMPRQPYAAVYTHGPADTQGSFNPAYTEQAPEEPAFWRIARDTASPARTNDILDSILDSLPK